MEVIADIFGAFEGPGVFVAPFVDAHDEYADGLFVWYAVVFAFEVVVVVSDECAGEVDCCGCGAGAEVVFAGHCGCGAGVYPGSYEQALAGAREFGCAVGAHAEIVADCAAEEDVVPPADVESGDGDFGVGFGDADLLPVVVVFRMCEPVVVVGRDALFEVGHVLHWEVGESATECIFGSDELAEVCGGFTEFAGEFAPVCAGERADSPGQVETEFERAALPRPAFMVVVGGEAGRDGSERGRFGFGGEPLGCADI